MPAPIRIQRHSPWVTQILVLNALVRREAITRFGEYRLGFFWMIVEPLLGTIVIGLIIGTIAERTVPEIPYPFFLLNGYLMLKLFTGPLNSATRAVGSNQGLLVYATVKPLDTVLSRFLFDLLTTLFSLTVFCVVGIWWGLDISLAHLHIVLASYVLTWMIGCGLGLIFGVLTAYYVEVEKIVMVAQRPLLFISAVLFPVSAIAPDAQRLLLYNPIVHTIELSRNAMFPHYSIEGETLFYPSCIAIVLLSIGLTLFQGNRNFLSQQG